MRTSGSRRSTPIKLFAETQEERDADFSVTHGAGECEESGCLFTVTVTKYLRKSERGLLSTPLGNCSHHACEAERGLRF